MAFAPLPSSPDADVTVVSARCGIGGIGDLDGVIAFGRDGSAPMSGDAEVIESGAMMRSWVCSFAIHAAVCGMSLWLLSGQAIVPQQVFQWDISLVSSSQKAQGKTELSDATSRPQGRLDLATQRLTGKSTTVVSARSTPPMITPTDLERRESSVAPPVQPLTREDSDNENLPQPTDFGGRSQAVVTTSLRETNEGAVPSAQVVEKLDGEQPEVVQNLSASDAGSTDFVDQPTGSAAQISSPSVAASNGQHPTHAKADFGWLMQMLWSRVTELKRYPAEARLNQWEGRVIVRAVIDEHGHLLEVAIATSSGHDVLDEDAIAVIKRACPLALSQPLGQSRVVLRVPIQYRLDS